MKGNRKISYRNLIILIIAIIALIIIGIAITMARYRTTGTTSLDAEVAFYVVKEEYQTRSIMLSGLYPREEPFEYNFTVSNYYDQVNIAEVTLDYTIEMKMTTNLPLEIEIYKNGRKLENSDVIDNNIVLDESGTCYIRKINIKKGSFIHAQKAKDTYTVSAKFPTTYKNDEEYQSMIDHVSIVIDAKQKIEE